MNQYILPHNLAGERQRLGLMSEFDNLYSDPRFWTSAITFIAAWGRKPTEIAA